MSYNTSPKPPKQHFIQTTTPTVAEGLDVGDIWSDTSGTATLKICTSVSPVTFAAIGTATVNDTDIVFTDNTTGNASTTKHGYLRKLDNIATHFLDGQGNWSTVNGTSVTTKGDLQTYDSAAARLPVGSNNFMLTPDSSTSTGLIWRVPRLLPSRGIELFVDFSSSSAGGGDNSTLSSTSGTSAANTFTSTVGITDGSGSGVVSHDTGTTSTGRAGSLLPSSVTNGLFLGGGQAIYEARIRVEDLSDGSETYTLWCGFTNGNNSALPTSARHAIWADYTHSVNSGKWALHAANGSTQADVNSTSAALVADTWYKVTIIVNAGATSAELFINDTSVATISSSMPTTTNLMQGGEAIVKSNGTTNRLSYCDYIYIYKEFTNSR